LLIVVDEGFWHNMVGTDLGDELLKMPTQGREDISGARAAKK